MTNDAEPTAIKRLGVVELLRLAIHPLTALAVNPIRLLQSLWACRVLADGKWGEYPHFDTRASLTALFYWTRAHNLYTYGRSGRAPYLALGDYPLARTFYYTLISLYAYWGAGAVTLLLGMFGWLLSHLVWATLAPLDWTVGVVLLAAISTAFYANLFKLQNYNVLGWMFFPLGLYGLVAGDVWLGGVGWFLVSLGGFTAAVIAGILCAATALRDLDATPILMFLPAGVKLASQLWPLALAPDAANIVTRLAKAIGVTRSGTRYARPRPRFLLAPQRWYLFVLYAQFGVAASLVGVDSFLFWVALALYVLNASMVRFADNQSIQMTLLSLATVLAIQAQSLPLLASFWLLASPVPGTITWPGWGMDVVPRAKPFSIKALLEGMTTFLEPIAPGKRVLMAFPDPGHDYNQVFGDYRVHIELPAYVASRTGVHFMPDWWAVFELNYEGAPDFWGRDVDRVLRNAREWDAEYVIVYQERDGVLGDDWEGAGFRILQEFRWDAYVGDESSQSFAAPVWWLLKVPA